MNEYGIFSFRSTHYAILAEKCLKEAMPICMIPTPREVSQSCGMSIKVELKMLEEAKQIVMNHMGAVDFKLFVLKGQGSTKIITEIII